ncbi:hypothetical protein QBC43DRAFT_142358 [Cladorrhinum sp. PSN259]|nr:hypothetical protein QBC43DRAFT_142358 [Cladorrhinum sp. PSN259]
MIAMTELSTDSHLAAASTKRRMRLQARPPTPKRQATDKTKASGANDRNGAGNHPPKQPKSTKSTHRQILPYRQDDLKPNSICGNGFSEEPSLIDPMDGLTPTTPEQLILSNLPSSDISQDWAIVQGFGSGTYDRYSFLPALNELESWQIVDAIQPAPKAESVEESTVKGTAVFTEDDAGTTRSQSTQETRPTQRSLALACPFQKKNPKKYRSCSKHSFQKIKEVKQHLRRRHIPEFICRRCYIEFKSDSDLSLHIKQVLPCKAREPPEDTVSEKQKRALQKYPERGKPLEDHWYEMWVILFPNVPRPKSVYVKTEGEETIESLREFWQEKKGEITAQLFGSNEEHYILDVLMKTTLDRFEQRISNKKSEAFKEMEPAEEMSIEMAYDSSSSACSVSTTSSNGLGIYQPLTWEAGDQVSTFTPSSTYSETSFAPSFTMYGGSPNPQDQIVPMDYSHAGLAQGYNWTSLNPIQTQNCANGISQTPGGLESIDLPTTLDLAVPETSPYEGDSMSYYLSGIGTGEWASPQKPLC